MRTLAQSPEVFARRENAVGHAACSTLRDLCSLEAVFVLFLFSGRYKMMPQLRGFPVDFTLFFFVATLVLMAWAATSGSIRLMPPSLPVVLLIIFSELVVASLLWSSLDHLNIDKAVRSVALTCPSFLAANIFAQDVARRRRLMRLLAWMSGAILFYYVYYRYFHGGGLQSGIENAWGTLPEGGDNYLEYGAHAGILFIIFLALAAFGSWKQVAAAIIGSAAALFLLATIGGRGPLVFALLAVPVLVLGLLLRNRGFLRRATRLSMFIGSLAALIMVGYLAMSDRPFTDVGHYRTLDRLEMQLSGEATDSMDERAAGQDLALRAWLEKPLLGWGIGEFRVKDSDLQYPHNLLLELLMEMGIIGSFLFFSIAAWAVACCVRIARDPCVGWAEVAVALLFLTELASHLTVQGYLADDRIFLAYMGLVIGCATVRRSEFRPVGRPLAVLGEAGGPPGRIARRNQAGAP
jgi:O-antigen ligase